MLGDMQIKMKFKGNDTEIKLDIKKMDFMFVLLLLKELR